MSANVSCRSCAEVCTVSDHIVTGEHTSARERQETFADMVGIALEAMLAVGAAVG